MEHSGTTTLLRLAVGQIPADNDDPWRRTLGEFAVSDSSPYRHLTALIVAQLEGCGLFDSLEESVRIELRRRQRRLIAADMLQREFLGELLSAHVPPAVSVVLMKGAAFSGTLYDRGSPRTSCDIDLLVPDADFPLMCSVMSMIADRIGTEVHRPYSVHHHRNAAFRVRDSQHSMVEIHRRLCKPHLFQVDYDGLWRRSRPHPDLGSHRFRIPGPEDSLMILAWHGYHHGGMPPNSLVDAFRLVSDWPIDQSLLIEIATRWGARTVLYTLLRQLQELFDAPIPFDAMQQVTPRAPIRALAQLLLPPFDVVPDPAKESRSRKIAYLVLLDRWQAPLLSGLYYLRLRTMDVVWSRFR